MISLADTIRSGDPDAIAGFRDAHLDQVLAYCSEVCAPERLEEACEAAFVEFLARVNSAEGSTVHLAEVLRRATRSVAAGRFQLTAAQPPGRGAQASHADRTICRAMPELLTAEANGELRGDPNRLHAEQQQCVTCADSAARMLRAERAFELASAPGTG